MTENEVSPLMIKIMLVCYAFAEPSDMGTEWHSPAGVECRKWLLEQNLIGPTQRATKRGEAWVKFICSTPLPVHKWILPDRENFDVCLESSQV